MEKSKYNEINLEEFSGISKSFNRTAIIIPRMKNNKSRTKFSKSRI
jgi:hypothetical protein